jgi:DegV family protein with EDD domain
MKKFKIITDAASDLDASFIEKYGIEIIPLNFLFNDEEFEYSAYGSSISINEIYSRLRNNESCKTLQVNPFKFLEVFERTLQEDLDILYISFSSGLSGTYQSSIIAKTELASKYPEQKIICLDSLCGCLGQGLLVNDICEQQVNGKTIEEITEYVESEKLSYQHFFTVNDLYFLKRGGRVSGGLALIGSVLHLKPILALDVQGKIVNVGKSIGRKSSLSNLVNRIIQSVEKIEEAIVYMVHGDCIDDVEYVKSLFIRKPKEFLVSFLGPVIGCHAGPDAFGIFVKGKARRAV